MASHRCEAPLFLRVHMPHTQLLLLAHSITCFQKGWTIMHVIQEACLIKQLRRFTHS